MDKRPENAEILQSARRRPKFLSLNSFTSASVLRQQRLVELGAAQVSSKAWDAHLGTNNMAGIGGEMGKEGLLYLEGIENATTNGVDGQCCFFSFVTFKSLSPREL